MMARRSASAQPPTAYSYVRFSSPHQAEGDSVRRQDALRDAWLKKSGAVLDTALTLRDEGVSAFAGSHRENPDRHALAAFLELVRRGRIRRGSYVVVESLDRLSREHIRPALTLLLNLIDAGVRIVQLLPVEAVYDEQVEPMTLMMAIMELSRGHSESRMKSERVGAAWKRKKAEAAGGKEPITRRVPAWLRVEDGRFVIDQERAAAVRRVYRMATEGHGIGAIVRRLNAERVPPVGRATYWARSYVAKLLSTRATVGEYQPHTRRGGPRRVEGEPVAGYFPAIITDDQWHTARAALVSRRQKGGRPAARRLHLFAGLLRDARDGHTIHHVDKGERSAGPALVSYRATNGVAGSKYVSFPLAAFESSVLSQLREIDPRDILPRGDNAADRVLALTGRLAEVESRIEKLQARLVEDGDVDELVGPLRTLAEKRARIADELARAKQEAASPLSEAWGEYPSLADAMEKAPDPADARVRLRSVLRRMVAGIWCLFVARGAWRLAAVRVQFIGDGHRDYMIVHKPATGGSVGVRPARTWVRSFADAAPAAGDLDLRKPAHARRLEKVLGALDPADLAAAG